MEAFEKVCEIISSQLGLSSDFEFTKETSWQEINADSLDVVEIVMSIEDEFGIEISDEDVYRMENLGDLVAFIENGQ